MRVTGVCCPDTAGGEPGELEHAFAGAVAAWGADAAPPITSAATGDGRVVALCRVADGAETLADRLQEAVLEPEEALDCVMQVAERLASWHERGLAHGYLRPETLLLQDGRIALLEPRLHAAAADALCRTEASLPSDPYTAPESGRFAPDALAADVFALGALLVQLVAGRPLRLPAGGGLEGSPIYQALPVPLQRTVAAALHPDPAQRLPGAQKLGLYLRVHRMWAASWDWTPLATLAAATADPVPAATTLSTMAAPAVIAPVGFPSALPLPEALPAAVPAVVPAADALVPVAIPTEIPPAAEAPVPAAATEPWDPSGASPEQVELATADASDWPEWLPRPKLESAGEANPAPAPAGPEQAVPDLAPPDSVRVSLTIDIHAGREQERIVIEGERATVGRPDPAREHYPAIDLRSDDAVSRRHAEFRRGAHGWLLVDLGSTNGTRLNGDWLEPHEETPVRDGDQVELGAVTTLRVHLG
jgi:hypothetical protein